MSISLGLWTRCVGVFGVGLVGGTFFSRQFSKPLSTPIDDRQSDSSNDLDLSTLMDVMTAPSKAAELAGMNPINHILYNMVTPVLQSSLNKASPISKSIAIEIGSFGLPSVHNLELNETYLSSFNNERKLYNWVAQCVDRSQSSQLAVQTTIHPTMNAQLQNGDWTHIIELSQNIIETTDNIKRMFVVSGPIFKPDSDNVEYSLDCQSGIAIPSHFFHVLLAENRCDTAPTNAIMRLGVFVLPNRDSNISDLSASLDDYKSDLETVEMLTGNQFFTDLDRTQFQTLQLASTLPFISDSVTTEIVRQESE